ncbi:hypothetical protein [Dyadobacter sp. OTU695]|uniref:hypothetical protein n=1 Tax=Dyadobacter sp. OTU695 TaxID=3043860 RepID=UPI00313A8A96
MADNNMNFEFGVVDEKATLTVLTGQAAKIYDPEKVQLDGIITAPSEYFSKRRFAHVEDARLVDVGFTLHSTHVIFNKEQRKIVLTVNEHDKFATVVIGSLKFNKFLDSLEINSPQSYSIAQLEKAFRFERRWFADPSKHKDLILKLRNFTAKITTTSQQENDLQGNKKAFFESKVSEFTKSTDLGFVLSLPVFDGLEKRQIPISVEIDVVGGSVALFLVCYELDEIIDEIVTSIFDREKEIFKDIVIIEQ